MRRDEAQRFPSPLRARERAGGGSSLSEIALRKHAATSFNPPPQPSSTSEEGVPTPDGFRVYPDFLDGAQQAALRDAVLEAVSEAPFYRPTMPRTGRPLSVEMTNAGPLGWMTDKEGGYRYTAAHPATDKPWPPIPESVLAIWWSVAAYDWPPECCLINLYRGDAKMGLHQDRDEEPMDAPVVSISLGDTAIFRIGSTSRKGPTSSFLVKSGTVMVLSGAARLAFHGIDRVLPRTSGLWPGGGRINLTLRRVTQP